MAIERTFSIIKPDATKRNLTGAINAVIEKAGLRIVAQATNTPLTWTDQLAIMAVLILSSKGAAGVTGAGFTTLVATLSVIPTIPSPRVGSAPRCARTWTSSTTPTA